MEDDGFFDYGYEADGENRDEDDVRHVCDCNRVIVWCECVEASAITS